jgi:hypothetical protein
MPRSRAWSATAREKASGTPPTGSSVSGSPNSTARRRPMCWISRTS